MHPRVGNFAFNASVGFGNPTNINVRYRGHGLWKALSSFWERVSEAKHWGTTMNTNSDNLEINGQKQRT